MNFIGRKLLEPLWEFLKEFDNVKNLIEVATILGVGITAIVALIEFSQEKFYSKQKAKREEISTFATYGDYLKEYRKVVQPAMYRFLNDQTNIKLLSFQDLENFDSDELYFQTEKSTNPDLYDSNGSYKSDTPERARFDKACNNLLRVSRNNAGAEVFYSDILKDFRIIHNFYEALGFALNNRVIKFETVFHLFTYPAYWSDQEGSLMASYDPFYEIETCLRDNWFGRNKPLRDFSHNFLQLGTNYHYKRVSIRFHQEDCRNFLWWVSNKDICRSLLKVKKLREAQSRSARGESFLKLY